MVLSAVPAVMLIAAIYAPIGSYDITFYLEKKMAVMMILMIVFLVVGGPGGHMGSHGASSSPTQASQPHEYGTAKPAPDKP